MEQLPNNLYSAAQTRELDRFTIEEFGIAGIVLMERAGAVAFNILQQHWANAKHLCIVCGTGNNGGDGFVVARLAHEHGLSLDVFIVGDVKKIKGDALIAKQRLDESGVKIQIYNEQALPAADVLVDAVFGTGLKGAVSGAVIKDINQHGAAILALDIPSGLLADSGHVFADAVKADVTISFVGLNRGLLTAKGPDCCGELIFDDLQIPAEVESKVATSVKSLKLSFPLFSKRIKNSHKGMFGHVLVMGGDVGMSGAARLSCEAALRTGAGLVSLATRPVHAAIVNSSRPEIMSHPVNDEKDIQPLIDKASVIAIGPGLGQSEWAETLFSAAINSKKPLVVDADALNLLAQKKIKRDHWILTPHPGEAARLLGITTAEVQADRFSAVQKIANKFTATVILKGCGTLIYSQGMTYLCDKGNPGMASGGMGDVLTGVIASLLAQGFSIIDAANKGVCLHASAADLVVKDAGEHGLLASDLLPAIRQLINMNEA